MRKFYKNFRHYIISKIMIIAFSFHRILVNVFLIMINILFHRNWNIKQKRRAGTISRQSPPSSVKFLPGLFTILNFLHPKAFNIETQRGESGFSRVIPWRAVDNSTLTKASITTTTTLFVPNSMQKYWRSTGCPK